MTLAFDAVPPLATGVTAHARRHRLIFRFAIFNLAALALLFAAYIRGWIDLVLAADESHLTVVISLVFLFGMCVALIKAWQINVELNNLDTGQPKAGGWVAGYFAEIMTLGDSGRAIAAAALRLRLASWIGSVRHLANSLVLMGLIGTVIGFVIALSGVDPRKAGDATSIAPMVAQLITGMSVALYTTLVGAVLNLWLMANFHMLNGGAVRLATGTVVLGESHARS
jgi:hypothetical protein